MKKIILSLTGILSLFLVWGQPSFEWMNQYQNMGSDHPKSISTDASGNVYRIGTFGGTLDADPGAGVSNITANLGSQGMVTKVDAAGNFVWVKTLQSDFYTYLNAMVTDANGNTIICGLFSGTLDLDPGAGVQNVTANDHSHFTDDIFVVKLDQDGNFIWGFALGSEEDEAIRGLALDGTGNVYLTGEFDGPLDFDPGAGNSTLTPDGNFADGYVAKYDANGSFLWAKKFEASATVIMLTVEVDHNDEPVLAGYFGGSVDFDPGVGNDVHTAAVNSSALFCVKLNSSGDQNWSYILNGVSNTQIDPYSMGIDNQNNIYLAGWFLGTLDFDAGAPVQSYTSQGSGFNGYLMKLDPNRNFQWAYPFTEGGLFVPHSMTLDDNNNLFLSGYAEGTIDFDPKAGQQLYTSPFNTSSGIVLSVTKDADFKWVTVIDNAQTNAIYSIHYASQNLYLTAHPSDQSDYDPGAGIAAVSTSSLAEVTVKWNLCPKVLLPFLTPQSSFGTQPALFDAAENGTLPSYNSISWEISTDNGSTFNPVTNGGNFVLSGTTFEILDASTYLGLPVLVRYILHTDCGDKVSKATNLSVTDCGLVGFPAGAIYQVCSGDDLNLSAGTPVSGYTYSWLVSNDQGATWTIISENATYSGSSTALLTVSGINQNLDGNWYTYSYNTPYCGNYTNPNHSVIEVKGSPIARDINFNFVNDNSAQISWLGNADYYTVRLRWRENGTVQNRNQISSNTFFELTNLNPGVAYSVIIIPRNNCGGNVVTGVSVSASFTTLSGTAINTNPCARPEGLYVTDVTETTARLHWSNTTGASTQYRIIISNPNGTPQVLIAIPGVNLLQVNATSDYFIDLTGLAWLGATKHNVRVQPWCNGSWVSQINQNATMQFYTVDPNGLRVGNGNNKSLIQEEISSETGLNAQASLYPNPAVDALTLSFEAVYANASIEIMDVLGRVVQKVELNDLQGSQELKLDVNALNPGTHLIRIIQGDQTETLRFIKQ